MKYSIQDNRLYLHWEHFTESFRIHVGVDGSAFILPEETAEEPEVMCRLIIEATGAEEEVLSIYSFGDWDNALSVCEIIAAIDG